MDKQKIISRIQKFSWREKNIESTRFSTLISQIRHMRSHGKNTRIEHRGAGRLRNGGRISLKCGTGDRGSRTRRSIADVELHRPLPPRRPLEPKTVARRVIESSRSRGREHPTTSCVRRLSGSMNDFRAALPRYVCILHPLLVLASRVLSFPAVYY